MEIAQLIHNPVFVDNRGTFAPLPVIFGEGKLDILRKKWLQSNISVNPKKLTLRGLHYQSEPYSQTKLVKVITGKIIDFVVDIRVESKDFGKCFIFEVSPNTELYVPKGFAHGFITTEDNTVVQYLVDDMYHHASEGSISWESIPMIVEHLKNKIEGFNPEEIIISDKDKVCQTITDYIKNNI
jgi:dTDP-4-dehydrorhamnose 3,5-epimerase